MLELSLDGVKKYLDTTLVLKNISFHITENEKVGIVGENGSGKTTILKLIAGILKLNHCAGYPYAPVPPGYDEGFVKLSKDIKCSYLDQIPQYADHLKVIDVLNLSFSEVNQIESSIHELEQKMGELKDPELKRTLKKYGELLSLYELKGGYQVKEKLSKICKGLNFSDTFLEQTFQSLSGGEKTTVVLGKLLIDAPNVLLLDEPTNHLDMDSVEWLEDYIQNYKGIVIVVSHDRYFLDHTVSKIIEIEDKQSNTYFGNYTSFIQQKEENFENQLHDYKEQKKKRNNMKQSIKDLRDWAEKADNNKFFKRAASMQKKLDKMVSVEKPAIEKKKSKVNINLSDRSAKIVMKVNNLTKKFDDKLLFSQANLTILYGERVGLIGPNGCGKTTFLKMLLNLESSDGGVTIGENVRVAYLPQNIEFIDTDSTVFDYFRDGISISEEHSRKQLAKFMFYGANVFKRIKLLSGGERVRLKLAKILFEEVNLLILDEPTNHLDALSIESIEEALLNFKGTIFLISHDRYFINKICNRVIEIENHTFYSYNGNYEDYRIEKEKKIVKNSSHR